MTALPKGCAPAPDFTHAYMFTELLAPFGKPLTFQTFDDNAARKDRSLTSVVHGNIFELWEDLLALNRKGAGVYVTANATDGKGRKTENIIGVRAVFADLDEGIPTAFPLRPSMLVETSPGKYQAWWLVEGLTFEEFAAVMERIVRDYGGDHRAKDLARVLRLSGFLHQKREPHLVTELSGDGTQYTRDQILSAFPPLDGARTGGYASDGPRDGGDPAVVREALTYLPADDRERWIQVGMALKQSFGDSGFVLWDEWSKTAKKYEEDDQWSRWNGLNTGGSKVRPVTVRTIMHAARKQGWVSVSPEVRAGFHATPKPPTSSPGESLHATDKRILDPSNPVYSARGMMSEVFAVKGRPTLARHRGESYCWDGTSYQPWEKEALRKSVYDYLGCAAIKDKKGDLVPFKPTKARVDNVIDALSVETHMPANVEAPTWRKGADCTSHPAAEFLPCSNGLLHLPTRALHPLTPDYFAFNALPYAYTAVEGEPNEWLRFLASLWPEDPQAIGLLQEWFGLCLTSDTSYQKMLLIVGPPRAGKGTISAVLSALLGPANVASPALADLSHNFGLQSLIGKSLAIIADARLSGRADQHVIVERLLSISGEDTLTVDRKFKDPWQGRLAIRVMLMSNEIPRLADASGAFASRNLVLKMTRSFLGEEDIHLKDRLLAELPEILNWSLRGLDRLTARGRFLQPSSARQTLQDFEDLGSPIGMYLRERCEIGPNESVEPKVLFADWCAWCNAQGINHRGTIQTLGRDLQAALPTIETKRPRGDDGDQRRQYVGVGLRKPTAGSSASPAELSSYQLTLRKL